MEFGFFFRKKKKVSLSQSLSFSLGLVRVRVGSLSPTDRRKTGTWKSIRITLQTVLVLGFGWGYRGISVRLWLGKGLLVEKSGFDDPRTRAFVGKAVHACHGTVSFSHCWVLSFATPVALFSHRCRIALLAFAHLTFALLSHSHCWPFRTVGIRTVGFALVSFALLSFALLSYKPNGVLYTHWSESWSLKCELLFVSGEGRGFQVKLILFVSLGFCELLRWSLTCRNTLSVEKTERNEDKTAISAHSYSKNTSLIQAKNGESAAFPRSFHPNYCWTRDTPETDNLPLLFVFLPNKS